MVNNQQTRSITQQTTVAATDYYKRLTEELNKCFDDIELFVRYLEALMEYTKELERDHRRKEKKSTGSFSPHTLLTRQYLSSFQQVSNRWWKNYRMINTSSTSCKSSNTHSISWVNWSTSFTIPMPRNWSITFSHPYNSFYSLCARNTATSCIWPRRSGNQRWPEKREIFSSTVWPRKNMKSYAIWVKHGSEQRKSIEPFPCECISIIDFSCPAMTQYRNSPIIGQYFSKVAPSGFKKQSTNNQSPCHCKSYAVMTEWWLRIHSRNTMNDNHPSGPRRRQQQRPMYVQQIRSIDQTTVFRSL